MPETTTGIFRNCELTDPLQPENYREYGLFVCEQVSKNTSDNHQWPNVGSIS
jgi:hypothetical protein